jgi:Zn-dependent protease with chaperone function
MLSTSISASERSIRGTYFAARSSRKYLAELFILEEKNALLLTNEHQQAWSLAELRLSPPLGRTPRRIDFPDGGKFISEDHEAIARYFPPTSTSKSARLLHRLETWRWGAVGALLASVLLGVVTIKHILPAMASPLSRLVPQAVLQQTDRQLLALLDRQLLTPSHLSPGKQTQLRMLLQRMAGGQPTLKTPLSLQFRQGGKALGANAFALPGGLIVITDELVRLSRQQQELEAILAHEMGHIAHRHGLQQLFRHAGLALILSLVTTDATALAGLLPGLAAVLIERGYSRQFEREADLYCRAFLRQNHISPAYFSRILRRIGQQSMGTEEPPLFLSTHPSLQERIRLVESSAPRP